MKSIEWSDSYIKATLVEDLLSNQREALKEMNLRYKIDFEMNFD